MLEFLLSLVLAVGGNCDTLTEGEATIVAETNAARASAGLPSLEVDCSLMERARRHANHMATTAVFAHSGGSIENIASGQPHAKSAVRAWLNSPGHRANIMNRSYRRIGVAGYVGRDGKTYWVQQFSR